MIKIALAGAFNLIADANCCCSGNDNFFPANKKGILP